MKELYDLKELYLDEIKRVNKKGDLTPADNDAVKKALEAIKMIDEICDADDGNEYSERSYRDRSYRNRMSRRHMPEMDYRYDGDRSYRRGRSAMTGRYVSRRNATADMMIEKLEDLLRDAPDMETRDAIECALDKLEQY